MAARRGRPPLNHSFAITDAVEHGVDGAIFLNHLRHFLTQHAANRRHIHDGEVWNYNSSRALEEIFPYWSRRQMQRIVKSLMDAGVVKTENHNAAKNDRTLWYTIPGFLADFDATIPLHETVQCNAPNGAMDCTDRGNAMHGSVQSLKESIQEPIHTNKGARVREAEDEGLSRTRADRVWQHYQTGSAWPDAWGPPPTEAELAACRKATGRVTTPDETEDRGQLDLTMKQSGDAA